MSGKKVTLKPQAYMFTDESNHCNLMLTTYKEGMEYEPGLPQSKFSKVVLGKLFL